MMNLFRDEGSCPSAILSLVIILPDMVVEIRKAPQHIKLTCVNLKNAPVFNIDR